MQNYRIFLGKNTRQVDGHTGRTADPDKWYYEPEDYDGDVLWSEPYDSVEEAEQAIEE